jgi:hypothetical protein
MIARIPTRYDATFVKSALDHTIETIRDNADTRYAAQMFRDARAKLRLIAEQGEDVQGLLIDRLLPLLESLPRLPPGLVEELIQFFDWPWTPEALRQAENLRPDVRELLQRHMRENAIGSQPLVKGRVFLFSKRHPMLWLAFIILTMLALGTVSFLVKLLAHVIAAAPVH